MWTFERKEVKDKAVTWCVEHKIEADPIGIIIALDALELLNDPAVEHCVYPTKADVPADADLSTLEDDTVFGENL